MAATDDVIEKGELEDTKVRRETICQERNVLTSTLQETEKDEEPDNKEGEGEEKKDECNTCKNDQEVVFIQVRDLTQPDSPGRSIICFLLTGSWLHCQGGRTRGGAVRHPGVEHGAGPGDPPAADGPRGHLPQDLLLPPAGRGHLGQLRRAQDRGGVERGQLGQGGGGALYYA